MEVMGEVNTSSLLEEVRMCASLTQEVRECSMIERVEEGMGSEECLKLWMEAEANCEAARESKIDAFASHEKHPVQEVPQAAAAIPAEPSLAEREEWTPEAVIVLLEAYEERLGEVNNGNLKGKDWEEVAAIVNRHCDGKSAPLCVNLCKRKVYALRRWYKTIRSKQFPYRPVGYEVGLLAVLDRIMIPYPYQAGIPGGIDAGERLSMPTQSSFDEEEDDDEEEESPATKSMGSGWHARAPPMKQLGKRSRNPMDLQAGATNSRRSGSGSGSGNGAARKKACKQALRGGSGRAVANALSGFAKVLTQIEVAKKEIMKDLDVRRAELQMKLTNFNPYPQSQSKAAPHHSQFV